MFYKLIQFFLILHKTYQGCSIWIMIKCTTYYSNDSGNAKRKRMVGFNTMAKTTLLDINLKIDLLYHIRKNMQIHLFAKVSYSLLDIEVLDDQQIWKNFGIMTK